MQGIVSKLLNKGNQMQIVLNEKEIEEAIPIRFVRISCIVVNNQIVE